MDKKTVKKIIILIIILFFLFFFYIIGRSNSHKADKATFPMYSSPKNFGDDDLLKKAKVKKKWNRLGKSTISEGVAEFPALFVSNNTPYIAYIDHANHFKVSVKKYNGSDWDYVGDKTLSTDEAYYLSLFVDNNTPYIAYADKANNYSLTVKVFDNNKWDTLSNPKLSKGKTSDISLCVFNNVPYIAFIEKNEKTELKVMKFVHNDWVSLGIDPVHKGSIRFTSLKIESGIPYIAYVDESDYKLIVKRFDGIYWNSVGSEISEGTASYPSLQILNNTPYIAFVDHVLFSRPVKSANITETKVKKFNGENWILVGTDPLCFEKTNFTTIQFYKNKLFATYINTDNENELTIKLLIKNKWITINRYKLSTGPQINNARNVSFAIQNDSPYVAFIDKLNDYKITALKYDDPSKELP
ncbi:MAG: hypothetical protein A2Y40_07705 [Candidatus Margulisbacteria bacterium GWF2_35_9]|nr:MAG: hypothetical protein A2Y40_07705 [Candidatus Margulisbacteria bacterium GWF2_35_9]